MNLVIKDQIDLQNNKVNSIAYPDNFVIQDISLKRLVLFALPIIHLTKILSAQELPEGKEKIQVQSDHPVSKTGNYNNILISTYILLILAGLGFLFFRIIDHKNKELITLNQSELREQIINELKTDHQLLASRAVLIGEEKERGRISRDLHDGLGGMLSGVKLTLSSIKNNDSLSAEMKEKLDLIQTQLNASISELRMIAQNLMPESLMNFGLKDALNDLCTSLKVNKNIEISFLFYGEHFRFDSSIETSLFRIAQEAINNALKYARASQIIVQLIQDESWINLTIQDNGLGFDNAIIQNEKLGGLKNMRARAESFEGRLNIDSRLGIGTEIIVEFICNKTI